MKIRRTLAPLFGILTVLVFADGADAAGATRYVTPTGSGSDCTSVAPCDIVTGINFAPVETEVIIGPGTYGSESLPISTNLIGGSDINLHGQAGAPRPVIYSSATWGIWPSGGVHPGPFISDLELRKVGGAYGLLGRDDAVIERVKVVASVGSACSPAGIFRDSLCIGTGAADGINGSIGGIGQTGPDINVYNVTSIATGTGKALSLTYNNYSLAINIRNSIFQSAGSDIEVNAISGANVNLNLTNSNFREFVTPSSTGTVTQAGGSNQSADPLFVNPLGEDYTQAAGSPTVDAGLDSADNGAADLAGKARIQGARTDIGAFESAYDTRPPVAPALSKFKLTKKKYKAAKKGKAFQAASAAKKKSNKGIGTTVSISSTGEGSIHFRLFKQVKKGKKKTWTLVKGVETVSAAAGTNKFWFSGRWGKKKLAAGTYQLRGTPTVKGNTIRGTKGDEPGTVKGPTSTVAK